MNKVCANVSFLQINNLTYSDEKIPIKAFFKLTIYIFFGAGNWQQQLHKKTKQSCKTIRSAARYGNYGIAGSEI